MKNQAFIKIWIIAILSVLVGGGILFYYSQTPKKYSEPSKETDQQEDIDKKEQIIREMIEEAKRWPGAGESNVISETPPEIIKTGQDVEGYTTYKNEGVGYEIKYPARWIVMRGQLSNCGTDCEPLENLLIQNMPYVSFPGNGPEGGSVFQIKIFKISSPPNLTIRSWIENADIPEQQKQQRINRIKTIEIAGESREVGTALLDVDWQQSRTFVDQNRIYQLTYFSGSAEQFNKELGTFTYMVSSFELLD